MRDSFFTIMFRTNVGAMVCSGFPTISYALDNMITVIHLHCDYEFATVLEAENHLSLYPASIRLDLHGVLDILPKYTPLVKDRDAHKIACISFVGPNTRFEAARDIRERITTGQIDFGVLVFKRGRGKGKFTFVEEGSKAWVNHHIPCVSKCIFVDDSTDHLRSTKFLTPAITCTLFNTGIPTQLMDILANWMQKDEWNSVGNAEDTRNANTPLV